MANDPKYVRLNDRLSRSVLVDVETHWGISGMDVQEFPGKELPRAQAFVRDALRRGLLEGASKAEYDEIQDVHQELAAAVPDAPTSDYERQVIRAHQEAQLQKTSRSLQRRVTAARYGTDEDVDPAYSADKARRERLAARAEDLDEGEVDFDDAPDADDTETALTAAGDKSQTTTREGVKATRRKQEKAQGDPQ